MARNVYLENINWIKTRRKLSNIFYTHGLDVKNTKNRKQQWFSSHKFFNI